MLEDSTWWRDRSRRPHPTLLRLALYPIAKAGLVRCSPT